MDTTRPPPNSSNQNSYLRKTFKELVIKTLNGEIDASYLILLLTDDTLPKALVDTIIELLSECEVRLNFKRDISEALIKRAIIGLPEDVRSELLGLSDIIVLA